MDWIEYLKSVDTPTLSNAIELLNVRPRTEGFSDLSIRCLFPEKGRMCGYAVTAQVETMTRSSPGGTDAFLDLYEAVADSLRPVVIVFQEIGSHRDFAAHCGEVMATVFTRLGAVGLVTDCGVRDLPEVRALGFQCFARGSIASHAYFHVARVGVPVQVGGLSICPGDLLHGDENGLLLVPPDLESTLKEKVEAIRSRERALMEYIRGSEFTLTGLRGHWPE